MGKSNNQLHHWDVERFSLKPKCAAYLSSIWGSPSLFYLSEWNSSIGTKILWDGGPRLVPADVEEWIGGGVSV